MTDQFDWSRFMVRINITAPAEALFKGWATRAGIEEWFLRQSDYRRPDGSAVVADELVQKGDTYTWLWHGYTDNDVERGTILETNGKDLFRFSFGKAGNCTVRIYKEHDEQIIELVQEQIPTDEVGRQSMHMGCKNGWSFYLANMKSIYEGGIDLRNKKVELQRMVNA